MSACTFDSDQDNLYYYTQELMAAVCNFLQIVFQPCSLMRRQNCIMFLQFIYTSILKVNNKIRSYQYKNKSSCLMPPKKQQTASNIRKQNDTVSGFVKLLQAKNLKQAKTYVKRIEESDTKAEQIVAKALQQCLVQKNTTPMGMTVALFVYKQLIMKSLFDYTQSQIFNNGIHKFVYTASAYNKDGDPADRGKNFYKDTLKAELSKQNQELGNTTVLLALEIIQMFAQWYPADYFTDQQSIYTLYFKKLKEKKVIFSNPKENVYLKPEQRQTFMKAHKQWIKKMDQLYNQEEETPGKPDSNIKNQKKEASNLNNNVIKSVPQKPIQPKSNGQKSVTNQQQKNQMIKVSDPIRSKIQSTKNQNLSESPSKSKIQAINEKTKQLLQKKKDSQIVAPFILEQKKPEIKNSNTQNSKSQVQKSKQDKLIAERKNQSPPPKFKQQLSKDVQDDKKNQKNSNRQSQIRLNVGAQTKRSQSRNQNLIVNNIASQYGKQKSPQKSPKSSRIQKVTQQPFKAPSHSQSPNIKYISQQIKKQQIRKQDEKYKNADNLISKSRIIYNQRQQQINVKHQIVKKNQQQYKSLRKTENNFYQPLNGVQLVNEEKKQDIPRKLFKTEKPQQQNSQNIARPLKKSMPKTEKRFHQGNDIFGMKFTNLSPQQKKKIFSGEQGQTLSDFRQLKNRKRHFKSPNKQIQGSQNLLLLIQRTRLGQRIIPFLPEYYKPVNLGMRALIIESMKLNSKSNLQPSKIFFKDSRLAIRLLKSPQSYILSINNISSSPISIGYSQALQAKYGDIFSTQIKVKGFQRKRSQQVNIWRVQPNNFADIPFQFYTNDPNLKFLKIAITINNQIVTFSLPITLLDQGQIYPYIDSQEISQYIDLYGRIIKSPPLCLSSGSNQPQIFLPSFFGRQKHTKIIGQMTYCIEIDPNYYAKVCFYIKKFSQHPDRYQIHAIYDNRVQINQDYAKVLLFLLCFLLCKQN